MSTYVNSACKRKVNTFQICRRPWWKRVNRKLLEYNKVFKEIRHQALDLENMWQLCSWVTCMVGLYISVACGILQSPRKRTSGTLQSYPFRLTTIQFSLWLFIWITSFMVKKIIKHWSWTTLALSSVIKTHKKLNRFVQCPEAI